MTVRAKVTNTGRQLQRQGGRRRSTSPRPQTGLDKPYQQLAGYAKTDQLAPGASQNVTITLPDHRRWRPTTQARAAYVMDAGDYLIRVGDSSRNTAVAAKLRLDQRRGDRAARPPSWTTRAVTDELTSDPANFYSYPGERSGDRGRHR